MTICDQVTNDVTHPVDGVNGAFLLISLDIRHVFHARSPGPGDSIFVLTLRPSLSVAGTC